MRGKCTRPMRTGGRSRNALVRRHARLTPEESRPLRLDATQQQRRWSRELPSIYLFSVWREKCVAGHREYFEELQKVSRCPQTGTNSVRATPLQFAQPVLRTRFCRDPVPVEESAQAEDSQG